MKKITIRSISFEPKFTTFTLSEAGNDLIFQRLPSKNPTMGNSQSNYGKTCKELEQIDIYDFTCQVDRNIGRFSIDNPDVRYDNTSPDDYYSNFCHALKTMKCSKIDLLIIGLRVEQINKCSNSLYKLFSGKHVLDDNTIVDIKNLMIVPLAFGKHISSYYRYKHHEIAYEKKLVIDIGITSFDWIVTEGITEIVERSGSYPIGMSSYVHTLNDKVNGMVNGFHQNLYNTHYWYEERECLYEKPLSCLKTLDEITGYTFRPAIAAMKNQVISFDDIEDITLIGEGATHCMSLINNEIGDSVYVTCENYCEAVEGLQILGNEIWMNMHKEANPPNDYLRPVK